MLVGVEVVGDANGGVVGERDASRLGMRACVSGVVMQLERP